MGGKQMEVQVVNRNNYHDRKIENFLLIGFFVGIVIGTVLINKIGKQWMDSIVIYNTYFYQQLQNNMSDKVSLFFYILKERIGIFLFLWIAGFSILGEGCFIAIFVYFGYFFAILLGTATMLYGPVSICIVIGILFPHYIIYGYGMYILKEHMKHRKIVTLGQACITLVFILIVCIAGVMAEAWINPYVLRWLL